MKYLLVAVVLTINSVAVTHAGDGQGRSSYSGEFEVDKPWQEASTDLPAAPSAATRFPTPSRRVQPARL